MTTARRAATLRRRWARVSALVAAIAFGWCLVAPSPYVIERPGPVFDTLGTVRTSEGADPQPVITIDGAQTYPTTGSLDMLTVNVLGSPDGHPTWIDVLAAWVRPDQTVLPMDAVFPPGTTAEQEQQANDRLMTDSQQTAAAVALRQVGYSVPATLSVADVQQGGAAEGAVQAGDVLVSVDGQAIDSVASLQQAAQDAGQAGRPVTLALDRSGQPMQVQVLPKQQDSRWVVGLTLQTTYDLPVNVQFTLDSVGGPSAGMMFTLATIDLLTEGSMTGGESIAGTGTIDGDGVVGAIGGIRQKMVAASGAGARFFLAPQGNCDEVAGAVPSGLSVVSVSDLDDALHALDVISSTKTVSGLPTCER